MTIPNPSRDDPLARRLRAEGQATTPPFSPLLHARIMARLRSQGLVGSHDVVHSSAWFTLRLVGGLATAAAVAVAAYIVLSPPAARPVPPTEQVTLALPAPRELVQQAGVSLQPTTRQLDDSKYAYLDRDAQRLAVFVADQLPTFGAEGNGGSTRGSDGK